MKHRGTKSTLGRLPRVTTITDYFFKRMMAPPHVPSFPFTVSDPEPTSPETEVKARVFAWCSAWSSIEGKFQRNRLDEIASGGTIRMTTDFGEVTCFSVSLDAYAAFWAPFLTETFSEWFLIVDSPLQVTVGDRYATACFDAQLQGIMHDGDRKSHRQTMQQTYTKSGGAWRLAQEQTKIAPGSSYL